MSVLTWVAFALGKCSRVKYLGYCGQHIHNLVRNCRTLSPRGHSTWPRYRTSALDVHPWPGPSAPWMAHGVVASLLWFRLHSSRGCCCRSSSHVLSCHLCILFGEMSGHGFCPFPTWVVLGVFTIEFRVLLRSIYKPVSELWLQIFSPVCFLSFQPLNRVF